MECFESSYLSIKDSSIDSFGNEYIKTIYIDGYYERYGIYNVGEDYNLFVGAISCSDETGSDIEMQFYIYGDNDPSNTLFEKIITRLSKPEVIDIDLSGVEFVTFAAKEVSGSSYSRVILSDGIFYK